MQEYKMLYQTNPLYSYKETRYYFYQYKSHETDNGVLQRFLAEKEKGNYIDHTFFCDLEKK